MPQVYVKSAMLTELVGLVRVLLPTNVQPVNMDIISPLLEVMLLMDNGVLVPNPVLLLLLLLIMSLVLVLLHLCQVDPATNKLD